MTKEKDRKTADRNNQTGQPETAGYPGYSGQSDQSGHPGYSGQSNRSGQPGYPDQSGQSDQSGHPGYSDQSDQSDYPGRSGHPEKNYEMHSKTGFATRMQHYHDAINRLRSKNGAINRLVLILLILVIIMLVIVAIPASKAFRYRSEKIGCDQAMKSAGDGLIIEYLGRHGDEEDLLEARNTLARVMPARENLCPAGGNVYLIKNAYGIYEPICGLHFDDAALRTRLNGAYGLNLLRDAREEVLFKNGGKTSSNQGKTASGDNTSGKASDKKSSGEDTDGESADSNSTDEANNKKSDKKNANQTSGTNNADKDSAGKDSTGNDSAGNDNASYDSSKEPESVDITLNGKTLTCVHVSQEEMIHRGTATTNGYKGTVAFYGVAGDFTFSAKTAKKGFGDAKAGEICYFVYADKDYCAIWRSNDGWTGDAYDQEALSGTTQQKTRTGYGTYYDEE